MNNKTSFSLTKSFVIVLLLLTGFGIFVRAGYVPIPTSIDNALQVIKRLLVTDDGTQTGNPVMDINTGGAVVVYGPLLDGSANAYITGYTEGDPVWISQKAGYYTKTEIDQQEFLISENDPFRDAQKSGYYTKLDIDAKGYLTGFTEIDSIFLGSDAADITSSEIFNRNTAYARGNHATKGYLTGETDPYWNAEKSSYYDKADVDALIGGLAGGLTYRGGWDYSTGLLPSDISLGDLYIVHGSGDFNGFVLYEGDQMVANKTQAGLSLTGDRDIFSVRGLESDPIFVTSPVYEVSALQISHWDNTYSRGDHSTFGYLTTESDPVRSGDKPNYYTKSAIDAKGYLTTYTETDPVFAASSAYGITNTNLTNWSLAYSRGDHRLRGYITGETDSVFLASAANNVTNTKISHWDSAYSRGDHASGGYLTGYTETDPNFTTSAASNVTNTKISHWDSAYSRGDHANFGYLTGETDPQIGTLVQDKGCYATGDKVVCDQDFTYDESDPVFMAASGDYYLASNPEGYITADTNVWDISGADISNNNTGNVLINKYLNIGGPNTLYPLYVWTNNTQDDWANYITVDGPADQEKGFQIGAGPTSSDYQRARYTDANEGGDKMYFINGESNRDVLTLAGGGRVGINVPTLLGTKTPPDLFSIFPQYFDGVLVYDGSDYIDKTDHAYTSFGDPFVVAGGDNYVLLGKMNKRRAMYVDIVTSAGNSDSMNVQYSKTGGQRESVVSRVDTTNRLKVDGTISRDMSAFQNSWTKQSIDGSNELYWIKVSLNGLVGDNPTVQLITNNGVNRFAVYAGAGDTTPVFAIDAKGRIGMTPPELSGKYEMGKLSGIPYSKMEVLANDGLEHDIVYYLADNDAENDMALKLVKSRGTIDDKLAVVNGDVLGGFHAMGYDGATFRDSSNIIFSVDGESDVMDMPGKISFSTTPDGDEVPVERMTIRNNGRVGIGTTSPTQTLTVSGNINVTAGYKVYDGSGNPYLTTAALNGYLTGFTETDPIWDIQKTNYYDKTGVDTLINGIRAGMVYQGSWDYSTGALPADIHKGDFYEISVTGTGYNGLDLYVRDMIIANKDVTGPSVGADWSVIIMDANPNIDPIFTASPAYAITTILINNWNTAFGRGNHATKGYLTGETDPLWTIDKTSYYTKNEVDNKISSNVGMSYQGSWDYSTGALPSDPLTGYFYVVSQEGEFSGLLLHVGDMFIANKNVSGFTTTGDRDLIDLAMNDGDPIFTSSPAYTITSQLISNWNSTYTRGDHRLVGYLTGENDPVFSASDAVNVTNLKISHRDTAYGRGNHAIMGYLTNASLTNYVTGGQLSAYVLQSQTGNRNTAFGRGDHASAGYLTGYTETDPNFTASAAHGITPSNITNRSTAYSRGNHADAGYIKSYTETDPVRSAASTNYYTKAQITGLGYITASALTPYVLQSQTGNRNTAFGRGNHASAGYLTGGSLTNYYTKAQVDGIVVTNSPWIATGTNYYYASGKIGIGLNNPIDTLEVLGTARFGGAASYSYFESDGTLVFAGNATVWNDINVGLLGNGGSSPDFVAINGSVVMTYCYDGGNTVEYAYSSAEMQHDRKEGTSFHPHLHMMPSAATAGTGKFTMTYIIVPTNGVATAPVDISLTQYFPADSAWKGYMPDFPEIPLTGYHIGDQISFRISRSPADAADTYTKDICLNSIGFHYEIDSMGSRLEYTK